MEEAPRIRRLRPHIYQPVFWFGVAVSDWPFIVVATMLSYIVPFILDLTIFYLPVPLLASLSVFVIGVAFFNWARMGRPPLWLQHQLLAWLMRSTRMRGALPCERLPRHLQDSWCLDAPPDLLSNRQAGIFKCLFCGEKMLSVGYGHCRKCGAPLEDERIQALAAA
jgi:hypothetical protein